MLQAVSILSQLRRACYSIFTATSLCISLGHLWPTYLHATIQKGLLYEFSILKETFRPCTGHQTEAKSSLYT